MRLPLWSSLIEAFFKGEEFHGRYTEIFKNPSIRELLELSKVQHGQFLPGTHYFGGIISPTGFYVWDREGTMSQHFEVSNFLTNEGVGIGKIIPVDGWLNPGTRALSLRLAAYSLPSLHMDVYDFPVDVIREAVDHIPNAFAAFKVEILESKADYR